MPNHLLRVDADDAVNQQPYFFNPGMSAEQLEDWLEKQRSYLSRFNGLVKEKAALEKRLSDISLEMKRMSTKGFEGVLSFP
ncbi:MAG: hypothetical protein RSA95_02360 [Citrobacter sp.]|uniref:hypothetical protein n=1 Tax=Citrobacter sp. TaxID=1896336 RepID=UPI002FCAA287